MRIHGWFLSAILLSASGPALARPAARTSAVKAVPAATVRAKLAGAKDCKLPYPTRCKATAEVVALGPGAAAELMKQVTHKDARVRAAAITALAELRHEPAGQAALAMLKDSDPDARGAAIMAAGELRAEGALPALANLLGGKSVGDAMLAATALGRSREPGAMDPLMRALRHFNPMVQASAARALAAIGEAEVVPALAKALRDPKTSRPGRLACAEALGGLKHPDAVPPLVEVLGEAEHALVWAATEALGKQRDRRAVAPLLNLLPRPEMATTVAAALGEIGSSDAVPGLVRILKEGTTDVSLLQQVFWALGSIGSPSAVAALKPYLKDEAPRVARWAAEALGRIRDISAGEALLGALRRPEREVREMALWSLQEISGKTWGEELELWEAWVYTPDR